VASSIGAARSPIEAATPAAVTMEMRPKVQQVPATSSDQPSAQAAA
jgi:hypothetical protein